MTSSPRPGRTAPDARSASVSASVPLATPAPASTRATPAPTSASISPCCLLRSRKGIRIRVPIVLAVTPVELHGAGQSFAQGGARAPAERGLYLAVAGVAVADVD